jgi:nitroreductase
MFLQTVMLIAREKGLHSCAQEAWAMWYSTVNKYLVVDDKFMLFCGMGIGYADENHPINSWRTDREEVDNFTTFYGFEK